MKTSIAVIILGFFIVMFGSLYFAQQASADSVGLCWTVDYPPCPGAQIWPWPHAYRCLSSMTLSCGYTPASIALGVSDCEGAECGCCESGGEIVGCQCRAQY